MRFLSILTLTGFAIAMPSTLSQGSQLQTLRDLTRREPSCKLPDPGSNCAGAVLKDVIIQYGKSNDKQKQLLHDVITSSGSKIITEMKDYGLSAHVPEPVLEIIKAARLPSLEIHDNACAEIPWCGEAPC